MPPVAPIGVWELLPPPPEVFSYLFHVISLLIRYSPTRASIFYHKKKRLSSTNALIFTLNIFAVLTKTLYDFHRDLKTLFVKHIITFAFYNSSLGISDTGRSSTS